MLATLTPGHLVLTLAVVLAAGCASSDPTAAPPGRDGATEAAEAALTLAPNQIVIGERIEFAGPDGKPVVPVPGIYRVEAKGERELRLYLGKARKALVLSAEKRSVALTAAQKSELRKPRALVRRDPGSPARDLLLFLPDGTVHGSPGTLEGQRARGRLLSGGSPPPTGGLPPTITSPASLEVHWNRLAGLLVAVEEHTSPDLQVSVVQRVTQRVMQTIYGTSGTYLFRLDHVDPGIYDVVAVNCETGVTDTVAIRVVGRYRSLAAGDSHSLALGPDVNHGAIWDHSYVRAWGANEDGQCGTRAGDDPVPFGPSLGIQARAVAAGARHSLMIDLSGGVHSWGSNSAGQLGREKVGVTGLLPGPIAGPLDQDVVEIAAGDEFSLALKSDGTVWAWGDNAFGQCGQGSGSEDSYTLPVQVLELGGHALTDVVAIAAGARHALALQRTGMLWGWGSNSDGQLDDDVDLGDVLREADPLWKGWTTVRVRAIEAAGDTSFATTQWTNGSLYLAPYGWGRNRVGTNPYYGVIGGPWPESLVSPTYFTMYSSAYCWLGTGREHVILAGVRGDNSAFMRGVNDHYELAESNRTKGYSLRFLHLDLIGAVGGAHHTVALGWEWGFVDEPVILIWGDNESGQRGTTPSNASSSPVKHEFH